MNNFLLEDGKILILAYLDSVRSVSGKKGQKYGRRCISDVFEGNIRNRKL